MQEDVRPVVPDEAEGLGGQLPLLMARLKAEAVVASPPDERPDRLRPSTISLLPELFQPRAMAESHIHELTGIAKSGRFFDAVEVIQVGRKVYLVDGHHRIEAYARAKVGVPVPVTYFEGTVEDAVLEAGRANSKAKLTMSNQERQDYAWRLVKMGTYKRGEIVAASSISLRQVAIMRQVVTAIGEDALDCDAWWKARRLAEGKASFALSPDELEERLEAQASDYARRMAKTFSTKLANNPELAARALDIYFGRKLPDLMRYLRDYVGDEETDEDPDF